MRDQRVAGLEILVYNVGYEDLGGDREIGRLHDSSDHFVRRHHSRQMARPDADLHARALEGHEKGNAEDMVPLAMREEHVETPELLLLDAKSGAFEPRT